MRGSLFKLLQDRQEHCVHLLQHFQIRELKNTDAVRIQISRARSVSRRALVREVLPAIDFDSKSALGGVEIEDVTAEFVLSPELHAEMAGTQSLPKTALGIRGLLSQISRAF